MPAEPAKVGPFVGGMNTYSGPSSIGDNEAVEIKNMEIDLDGTLVSRPAIIRGTTAPVASAVGIVIGTYRSMTDVFYVIYSFQTSAWALNAATSAWTKIADGDFTDTVQSSDKLWLVLRPSGTAVGGGSWTAAGGYVAIPAMPRGLSVVAAKNRLFIAASRNGDITSMNRVKYSDLPTGTIKFGETWNAADSFDVSPGDGQDIAKLMIYDNSIVIFKTDSTFLFAYDSKIAAGQVQVVSTTIGLNNNWSAVEYENTLFVMHEAKVYRITNWNWDLANVKIPFQYKNIKGLSSLLGVSLSVVGDRIVARYYDNTYVLGTKTGGWSVWEWDTGTTMFVTNFIGDPNIDVTYGASNYYSGSYNNSGTNWYKFIDQVNSVARSENYKTKLVTKAYDFGPSYSFKRLFWWGIDILSKTAVTFRVSPIVYAVPVTWNQVKSVTSAELLSWGRPLDISIDVSDSANITNPVGYRTFIKLLKSLRFRQIQFIVESTQNGLSSTGPLRIFSITAFVDAKQLAVKKVS